MAVTLCTVCGHAVWAEVMMGRGLMVCACAVCVVTITN